MIKNLFIFFFFFSSFSFLFLADIYVLAGVVALEEMGGPDVGFRWGRSDAIQELAPEKDNRFSPDGRLPGAFIFIFYFFFQFIIFF